MGNRRAGRSRRQFQRRLARRITAKPLAVYVAMPKLFGAVMLRKSYNLAGVLYSRPWSGRIGIKTSVRLPSVNFQNFYRGHFLGLPTIAGGTLGPGILSLEFPPKFQNPVNARLKDEFGARMDRKSTRLNSSHLVISYAVFCLKKKKE